MNAQNRSLPRKVWFDKENRSRLSKCFAATSELPSCGVGELSQNFQIAVSMIFFHHCLFLRISVLSVFIWIIKIKNKIVYKKN